MTKLFIHAAIPSLGSQKMLQSCKQLGGMLRVSGEQRGTDIVYDHLADFFLTMFLLQQILAQRGCRDLRHMFVLRDGRDFLSCQTAKRDAIFKGYHPNRIDDGTVAGLIRVKAFRDGCLLKDGSRSAR
jgi:hypothetical protein